MTVGKRISKARTELLLDHPWFGSLAMNLRIVSEPTIPTFDVDGSTMRYNPEFVDTLNNRELQGVIAHEVMHCALLHIYRRNGRDMQAWNQAADYAINQELTKAGIILPSGCLLDYKFAGLSAEVIYSKLQRQKQDDKKQGKQPSNNGQQQPTGTFSDAPSDTPLPDDKKPQESNQSTNKGQSKQPSQGMSEQDWKIAAEQAASVAKRAGKLGGELERTIKTSRQSKTDWRDELREFLIQTVPSDYSWTNPNRRYIYQGIYLPSTIKENFGRLAIAIDTSGSINQIALDVFAAEVNTICSELKPDGVTVIYCDSKINNTQESEGDEPIILKPCGGGGTRFNPVFEAVSKWDNPPAALLYFTDLECYDKPLEPDYPCLWVTGLDVTHHAPFGKVIHVEI